MATKNETPMMRQFRYLKSKHPDALLLFRCGDFYESYEEDAKESARVLGITLTKRSSDGTVMAGFPHHALDTYLPRLIRAGKRVAICDQLEDPKLTKQLVKRGITELVSPATNNSNNSKSSTTMETKTMTAQDYVGKTIKVNESNNFYVLKSADGDKLTAEFHMGDRVMPCPIPMSQLKTMVDAQKWTICDASPTTAEPIATAEPVAEEPKPVAEPTAKTVTLKPTTEPKKSKRQPKPAKSEQPEAPETNSKRKLRYETYENKKGKTCARIVGFTEGDAMLERGNAERIHASSTYERDKKGGKQYMLIFGPRYAAAAKEVCKALNEGKTLADCQAIIDQTTERRVQKREEWKAKRAAYLANRENEGAEVKPAETKVAGYSSEDVAHLLKKIMAGGAIPEEIKRAMAA